jgi:hypothetical protein
MLAKTVRSCEEMRPQAGVGKLKHAPPMRANDLPLVAQALSPANRMVSQLMKERSSSTMEEPAENGVHSEA